MKWTTAESSENCELAQTFYYFRPCCLTKPIPKFTKHTKLLQALCNSMWLKYDSKTLTQTFNLKKCLLYERKNLFKHVL